MPIRLNWFALIVATIASFAFEAVWFSVFMKQWLAGIGRTMEELTHSSVTFPIQAAVAFLTSFIVGIVLTILIQKTGPQTALRGVKIGALVWLGFVATSWAKEYIFEVRTIEIYLVNTVYCLFDLMLIGAIVGGWKRKA
jgi:hypothetical protein